MNNTKLIFYEHKELYEIFLNFHLAGSDIFYPKDTPIVHPLINKPIIIKRIGKGKRLNGKKNFQWQNWKISSIRNIEDVKDDSDIIIMITRNTPKIKESLKLTLIEFQEKLMKGKIIIKEKTFINHDGFDIPFLNDDVKYRLEDSVGCESFCKSIPELLQIDELERQEK